MNNNSLANFLESSDYLLIFGIILAPFTALRIVKFGPGEILLIIWIIYVFKHDIKKIKFIFLNYYQVYNLIMLCVGFCYNSLINDKIISIEIIIDYFSHLFMFLFTLSLVNFYIHINIERINEIIRNITIFGVPIYFILYLYAYYISGNLFGIKMWIGHRDRFMALALNPHQIGMITGAMIFFTLYLIVLTKQIKVKILLLLATLIWLYISIETKSDTLTLVYVLSVFIYVIMKLVKSNISKTSKKKFLFVIGIVFIFLLVCVYDIVLYKFRTFIAEAGNGEGRLVIWTYSLNRISNMPFGLLFGLGPGGNTGLYMIRSGHEMEAHNTYIQQILNCGISVFLFYLFIIYKLTKDVFEKNTYLVLNILYFVFYGCGGNMNRRALMWFTYATVWALFEKTKDTWISKI